MKKFIALLLALVMCLALVACGGTPANDEQNTEENTGSWKIGFSNSQVGNSWRQQMVAEFESRAEELVADGTIASYVALNADGDQAQQIDDIRSLITQGCNAILVDCITTDGLNDVIEEAYDEGIVVITFDNNCSTDKVTRKISCDNYVYGTQCGEWLGQQVEDGAKILVLDGTAGADANEQRHAGMIDGLNKYCKDAEILTVLNCDWDYATAKVAVEQALSAYPQIDGVLSQGGAMTQGAIDAFAAAGREFCPMTGEASNGFIRSWLAHKDEGLTCMAGQNPCALSAIALDQAVAALNGTTYDDINDIMEFGIIDESNVMDFYREDLSDSFWCGDTYLSDETLKEMFGL